MASLIIERLENRVMMSSRPRSIFGHAGYQNWYTGGAADQRVAASSLTLQILVVVRRLDRIHFAEAGLAQYSRQKVVARVTDECAGLKQPGNEVLMLEDESARAGSQ